jgi:hypothetical protein
MLKVSLNTNKIEQLYIIAEIDSGVNTNKTGHHVIRYTWHIVESVVEHQ